MSTSPLSHPRWRRWRQHWIATHPHPHCHICHQLVDMNLRWPHADSLTLDHLHPIADGGAIYDPANVAAAHKHCNERKGSSTTHTSSAAPASRQW